MKRSAAVASALGCVLALSSAGCGRLTKETVPWNGGAGGGTAGGNPGNAGSAGLSGDAGSGASAGNGGSGGLGLGGGTVGMGAPLPGEMRRLTAPEYQATVSDELGTTTQVDLTDTAAEDDGFDNIAAVNSVNDTRFKIFLTSAEAVAKQVFSTDALRARIVTCTQADDMTCVSQIITQTGLHLFRRPLQDDEVASYQKVYTRARARMLDHNGALNDVLVALLVSAQFLYRMEFVPAGGGNQRLTSYDIATRLSYLLWSSAPDDELLNAAQQDKLQADDALTTEATRLLQDPKSARFVQNFMGQWLDVRRLPYISFDPTVFTQWTATVGTSAAGEMSAFFSELLQKDQPWPAVLTGSVHFVNQDLGPLYGLTVAGPALQRMEVTGVDRQGLLGLVGFLALTSAPRRSEPSQRGAWIMKNLLCSPLPPTPLDMPLYDGSNANQEAGIRAYLQTLNAQPACASCHAQIDPLGLALENYDALGRFRTYYANASTIDPTATLSPLLQITGDGHVSGAAGLSAALQTSPLLSACAAQRLYVYGMGRAFSDSERPNVQTLTEQWRAGPLTLKNLIFSLVTSAEFRARSDGGEL